MKVLDCNSFNIKKVYKNGYNYMWQSKFENAFEVWITLDNSDFEYATSNIITKDAKVVDRDEYYYNIYQSGLADIGCNGHDQWWSSNSEAMFELFGVKLYNVIVNNYAFRATEEIYNELLNYVEKNNIEIKLG